MSFLLRQLEEAADLAEGLAAREQGRKALRLLSLAQTLRATAHSLPREVA